MVTDKQLIKIITQIDDTTFPDFEFWIQIIKVHIRVRLHFDFPSVTATPWAVADVLR